MSDDRTLLNRTQLARGIKVKPDTINAWVAKGCPYEQEGGQGKEWLFDPAKVAAWRREQFDQARQSAEAQLEAMQQLQAEFDLEDHEDESDGLTLRMRREYYEVDKKREERDLARRFLCRTAEVRQTLNEAFGFLSDRLQTLPDELERRCALDAEAVERAMETINEWQSQLARDMKQWQPSGQPGDRRDHVA